MNQQRDGHREAVCPVCNKVVAPYEPGRVPLGKEVIHGDCWKRLSDWAQLRLAEVTGAR